MKISDSITNKEAQDILKHSHRTQIVLDAEAEIKASKKGTYPKKEGRC